MTSLPSFTRYGDPVTQHNFFIGLLERTVRLDLTTLFPSFRNPQVITWLTTSVYVLAIAMITAFVVHQSVRLPRHQSGTCDHLPIAPGIDS